jgi:hydroxyacylglutathione hydrolase
MTYAAFPSGPFETNAYLLACPRTQQAVIIDPAPGSAAAIQKSISEQQLIPKEIWLTHSHWDHFADAATLKRHYAIPLAVHAEDAANVLSPGADKLPCWIDIEGLSPTHLFNDGEKMKLGELEIQVIHTPGHTPGGVCFYLPHEGLLFSGDTLFQGTIGNLSFPTGRPSLMWPSLAKLAQLPKETVVLPGHGPATTIGKETWLPRAEEIFG